MGRETIGFTEAEWRVMECLWAHAPLTGREADRPGSPWRIPTRAVKPESRKKI